MCGIAGLLDPGLRGAARELDRLGRAMGAVIAHRGPDAEGLHVEAEAGLALAHRRLSIVDLSPAGAQPMISADGRHVLIYNGELYNAADLRRHPALHGIAWKGHSDTEIMLESFARRGIAETLDDLNGMFALALFDRQSRALHLIRDRLGIKPLFFARKGGGVYFGSELRSLLTAGIGGEIDPSAVAAYLRYGYVPTPGAIFAGVGKLAPGEWITFAADGSEQRRTYWDLAGAVARGRLAPLDLPDEEAVETLHSLLLDAVSRQMIADVPLGAFLSGGVDSSTIVAMMVAAGQGRVRTFSIGFPDLGFDESAEAAAVARHLGTEHTTLVASEAEALDVAPRLGEIFDEPFADSSQIPTYLVSRLTRNSVSVALSGDGGDELFAGYNRYVLAGARWPAIERIPLVIRRTASAMLGHVPVGLVDASLGRLPGMPRQLGDKLIKAGSVIAADSEGLYRRLISQIPNPADHLAFPEPADRVRPPEGLDLIDRMRFLDTLTYLPDDILQKVDRASMAVALEARPPLLDHRVVEFAWRLPRRQLLRDGRSKWILRRVLDRHVPRRLIERPKMGFAVPLADWLRGPLRDWAGDLLHASDYGGGLLRAAPARVLWREHGSGGRNHAYQLWTLLMFETWRRRWVSPSPLRLSAE